MDLRSECTHCGDWGIPTGVAWRDEETGRTYVEFECPQGHRFDSWRQDWEQQGLIPSPGADAEIVKENASRGDVIFLPMVAVFAIVAVIAYRGAETTAGRITGSIIFGLLTLGFFILWLLMRLRPARLEVTQKAVTYAKRNGKRSQQLLHTLGELRLVYTQAGSGYRRPMLHLDGSKDYLEIQMFDTQHVIRACENKGWQFLD